jgi:N utilization substance protein A
VDINLRDLKLMESEKGIPFDELVTMIESAILAAYQKHIAQTTDEVQSEVAARVELDRRTGIITVYVPELDDEGAVIGEAIVTPEDFGRIAAFAAKQVMSQRMRELADEKILGDFKGHEGDILAGIVQQGSNPNMIPVDLGTLEAQMPKEEFVPGEEYTHGRRMRVYVTKVERGNRGPQVTVSRTHPGLVRKLFALEVPEIGAGLVEIVNVARQAGHRSKVAVAAKDPSINAKGACIGELGRRVRAVQEELNEEKIDIVEYSPDLATFVANALSPAKVTSSVVVDEAGKAVRAFVPDYQLSLAIGKDAQNVRLAARLTGARIDIQPDSRMNEQEPVDA